MSAAAWTVSCSLPAGWWCMDVTDPSRWPAGWEPTALRELLRLARATGVVLSAARGRGSGTPDDPLSLLTLSLAVRPWPAPGRGAGRVDRPRHAAVFEFEQPMLSGYLTVARYRQPVPGGTGPVSSLLIQVIGFAAAPSLVVALSATTADPAAEDELATAAAGTGRSIRLAGPG